VTGAEWGELICVVVAASAQGTFISPMLMFPRKYFGDLFIRDSPTSCIGAVMRSGWLNEESFVKFTKHLIRQNDDLVLLLLDNHSSDLSGQTLDLSSIFPVTLILSLTVIGHRVFGRLKNVCNRGIHS
jgi:hypothetical protein